MEINGDLIPTSSGFANLGIDVGPNAQNAFDITTLAPFNNIHLISGVWHDPIYGQSGVVRYSRAASSFQVSVDGGLTFNDLVTGATVVSSIGVIGDANLTGHVDLATPASGFMVIFDTADASPLQFAVDQLGLSGLWQFPTQGFNGRVVNALTDFNGTEAQGVINVVGASGIVVDIIGNTLTVTNGNTVPRCYAQTISVSALAWVINHNLNTSDIIIAAYNSATPRKLIIPDSVALTSANTVTLTFNTPQVGRIVVVGCY